LNVTLTQTQTFNPTNVPLTSASLEDTMPTSAVSDVNEAAFEIGFWFSGLESFLNFRNHSFTEESRYKAASRDWTKEFRLTHSTLLLCSKLILQSNKAVKNQNSKSAKNDKKNSSSNSGLIVKGVEIRPDEIHALSQTLKEAILLNEGMLRAAPLKFAEWTAWTNLLAEKLKNLDAFEKFVSVAEKTGEQFLPEVLQNLLETKPLPFAAQSDLRMILSRLAKILKWLSVVEKMLKNDAPLKSSLLIFSRIYEQIQEMIGYVNNRLLRFPDEEDELFGSLDGAAYTASIELRKVYNHELTGVAEIRSTPSIYAKIETAYSLLNDSFQQTLVNFAQLIEPNIEPSELFPNFQIKLEQSLILRQNLRQVLESVREVEKNPETDSLDTLQGQLRDFLDSTIHFLFYKDMETVERFIEEVLVTKNKKDLVPLLHRFGAYLETLFGQVNMRAVLAKQEMRFEE
jgi:hypothetical protein